MVYLRAVLLMRALRGEHGRITWNGSIDFIDGNFAYRRVSTSRRLALDRVSFVSEFGNGVYLLSDYLGADGVEFLCCYTMLIKRSMQKKDRVKHGKKRVIERKNPTR